MRLGRVFKNNLYMFKYVYEFIPLRIILSFLTLFIQSIFNIWFSVLFVKYILDGLTNKIELHELLLTIILTCISVMIVVGFGAVYSYLIKPILELNFEKKMNMIVYSKAVDVEIGCYDNPEFYNSYIKALNEASSRAIKVTDTIIKQAIDIISTVIVLSILINISPASIIFAVIPVFINIKISILQNKVKYKFNMENIYEQRKKSYIQRVIYLRQYAKEIRLSSVKDIIFKYFDEASGNIIKIIKRYGLLLSIFEIIISQISEIMIYLLPIGYITYKILNGELTIGDYSALIMGINNLNMRAKKLFDAIPKLYEHNMYIENFKKFMDYEPKIKNIGRKLVGNEVAPHNIEIKNLSFSYNKENCERNILNNININIKCGEKVALVGTNGAGKTTLVKLIMRLYDPDEGGIFLNGEDIRNYELKSYRSLFGTVFQNFQYYSFTIAENVLMRKINSAEEDGRIVVNALEKCGLLKKVMNFKNDINTVVTKEFDKDGVMLSGGELQKLALARIFAKDSDIIILDEPSSALDPISEYDIYKKIIEATENKTVIFISHRLSTTVDADRIYLVEGGEVIESGSHNDLIQINGKYAKMFRTQAEKYIENLNIT